MINGEYFFASYFRCVMILIVCFSIFEVSRRKAVINSVLFV